jgi:membrane protease YdiL (CAAX protease family)
MKRPPFWILLGAVSIASAFIAIHYFPQAFSIVSLAITMDRDKALADARALATDERLGPPDFRQAASFTLDSEAQTFVELEGGGKEAFTSMMREGLYSAYTWRVRHFKEGEANETLIRFRPDGQPYGFEEHLKEDAPGPALDGTAARRIAEERATAGWHVDLQPFSLVEQGQERRTGGRVDHTLTYERPKPALNEGRYRLRLVVSGDRLTEVTYFLKIPEAFDRRYANMRSANDAIGLGSAVGLMVLYVVGGIGVGLFYMLRQRFVIWRPAVAWGIAVSGLQTLAAINQFPLLWMTYDTAVPRSTFLAQQTTVLAATFIGFGVFFGLSFMAAETLTRRAFGSHPQLWRAWSPDPGRSVEILGRTAAGFLLVSVFVAYDVLLYLFANRVLGWWSPAEALLNPDVLAAHVPWFSAIATSFQAGFWEESLFRAVPIAGAALIGDRFGQRKLFIVLAFVVQALIFGAGHAPYPNQPSYARPVELILPSIGFGLIYLYCGLLPGIILHFGFDTVLFALPIFFADAPGIWIQKVMVVAVMLVPLWVVLWRRAGAGRWTTLSPGDRNAAWVPPAAVETPDAHVVRAQASLSPRLGAAWLGLGAVGAIVAGVAIATHHDTEPVTIKRAAAAEIARRALDERQAAAGPKWRVMPIPDNGGGGPHEFVSETAGEARRRELLGSYLPKPRWNVRVATFEGDVADRAEEWDVIISGAGELGRIDHTIPEGRAGASLDEAAARQLAEAALVKDMRLDISHGEAREVLARPKKQKARTDWTFNFVDTTVPPLPKGEPRVLVEIAGNEVVSARRFVYVPEDWERQERAAGTRQLVLTIVSSLVYGGVLVATAVFGVVAWSRKQYTPRLFLLAAALMFLVTLINLINGWPGTLANIPTVLPLPLAIATVVGGGIIAMTFVSSLVGLVMGLMPRRLADAGELPDREAIRLGLAAGLFGSGVLVLGAWLRTPTWGQLPDLSALATLVPSIDPMTDGVSGYLYRSAVVLACLTGIDRLTSGWTRRRALGGLGLAVVGFLGAGAPTGSHVGGWAAAGLVTAAGLVWAYVTLLRYDLTLTALALAVMIAIGTIARGAQRPFPGALSGALVAAVVVGVIGWWWFRLLRNARRA